MKALFTTWTGRIAAVFILTVVMAIGGVIVDPSYFQNPLGESEAGILADEGYDMPATTEVEFVADGVDPLQVDLSSIKGDFSGTVEMIDPNGKMILTDQFALRFQPKSFLPNPSKWETFYAPATQKGTFRLRLTQDAPGKARVFFYQGPFWTRMLMLPIIAAFFTMVIAITLSPGKAITPPPETNT